jgi:CHAT domain-containing protein
MQYSNLSTPLLIAGFISFFISGNQLTYAQTGKKDLADSLITVAGGFKFVDFRRADSVYSKAALLIRNNGIERNALTWVHLLHQRILTAIFHNQFGEAKNFLGEAYDAVNQYSVSLGPKTDSLLFETRLYEANYDFALGMYNDALENLDRTESYLLSNEMNSNACQALYGILQFQATIYQLQGEFESCIDRYLASIKYYDCHRDKKKFPNYILAFRNIGVAYSRMRNMHKAREYFFAAKQNLDSCPEKERTFYVRNHALTLYNSLADFYIKQGRYDSAKYMYMLALPVLNDNPTFVSRVNEGLARVALNEKKYADAHRLFFYALDQTRLTHGEKNYITSQLYLYISELYQETKEPSLALQYIQKALQSLSTGEIDTNNFAANPSASSTFVPKIMVTTLNRKATVLAQLYKENKKPEFLKAAWETSRLALQLVDSTRNGFSLEKDKVVLGDDVVRVYETALDLASQLFTLTRDSTYLEKCFSLIDKSKGAVLSDHLKLVRNFAGIPKKLFDRERELKAELSAAEERLYKAEMKKQETTIHLEALGKIKKEYSLLLSDIRTSAPAYYNLRIENHEISLADVRRNIKDNDALVEYFLGDFNLYILVVSTSRIKLYVGGVDSLRAHVVAIRNLISEPAKLGLAFQKTNWEYTINQLSNQLVWPWIGDLKSKGRIKIIPHDVLNYLPFELLRQKSGDLMLSTFSISYASSVSLLTQQNAVNVDGDFFGGFHADYSNQRNFPQLQGAVKELSAINNIFGFRSSTFGAATADEFRKKASRFKIIHLALHSQINDEKPMFSRLIFTKKRDDANSDITANELYGMDLNAEIAVLSACETGLGKLQRGEGMMSFSRAFMYAGVPSTVISLWKVPDQTTSILMTKFYEALRDGETKDDALRTAKLSLIHDHPEMSHPFFWAGFIVNGKTDPVSLSPFSKMEVLVGLTFVAIVFILISVQILRRRKLFQTF